MQNDGLHWCRHRCTRSTTRRPSRWSTVRSTSSPRDAGSCSPPDGTSIPRTHAAGSCYYFTNPAMGKKLPAAEDPKRDQYKTKADIVAFVKTFFADGAA